MFRFDRLRELAKNQHRSMRYLCDIAGKSPSYIVDAEKKGSIPKPDAIRAWSDALSVSPKYLTGESDDPAEGIKKEPTFAGGHSLEAVQFAKEFSDLTQEDWHKLREYADFLKSRHTDK